MSTPVLPADRSYHRSTLASDRSQRGQRPRRRWTASPLEGLEGRALLAVSALDPSFNGGQPILVPADSSRVNGLDTADAAAVQSNGQVVVVGQTFSTAQGSTGLVVRRFDANGSPDTTFGTDGTTTIPLPGSNYSSVRPLPQVLIGSEGQITLAATLTPGSGGPTAQASLLVTRLSSTGALDPSFGTAGESLLAIDQQTFYASLGQLSGGRIVLGGSNTVIPDNSSSYTNPSLLVLANNGSIDPTFNGGNPLVLDAATYGGSGAVASEYLGLAVTPQDKIVVAYRPNNNFSTSPPQFFGDRIAELNADGTLNASFGSGGITVAATPSPNFVSFGAIAVGPTDGRIVLAAQTSDGSRLLAFTADGKADPTFSNPALVSPYVALAVADDGRILVEQGGVVANLAGRVNDLTVRRYLASGAVDTTFGPAGAATFNFTPVNGTTQSQFDPPSSSGGLAGLAVTAEGQVIVVGTYTGSRIDPPSDTPNTIASQAAIVRFRAASSLSGSNNDYDGDNISDFAAQISSIAQFAYRPSTGPDVLQGFGYPGSGTAIPAPGDYDGDGKTDVAAYLPALGVLAYRPSTGGADVYIRFGPGGFGNAIPVPGDYDGDGKTDVAIYLTDTGTFAIRPSSGAAPYAVKYGASGAGQTIPVVADYDGDGTTDLAVYIPALGQFYRRLSTNPTTADTAIDFGPTGLGASIPAPGDYLGIGSAQFAIYLPDSGTFAILAAPYTNNYAVQFGAAGAGQSIPTPGDYDGDGKTDFAVYLPTAGSRAYRPSGGGNDVTQGFGPAGLGQTEPAAASPAFPTGTVRAQSLATVDPEASALVPLTDLLPPPASGKKTPRA